MQSSQDMSLAAHIAVLFPLVIASALIDWHLIRSKNPTAWKAMLIASSSLFVMSFSFLGFHALSDLLVQNKAPLNDPRLVTGALAQSIVSSIALAVLGAIYGPFAFRFSGRNVTQREGRRDN